MGKKIKNYICNVSIHENFEEKYNTNKIEEKYSVKNKNKIKFFHLFIHFAYYVVVPYAGFNLSSSNVPIPPFLYFFFNRNFFLLIQTCSGSINSRYKLLKIIKD